MSYKARGIVRYIHFVRLLLFQAAAAWTNWTCALAHVFLVAVLSCLAVVFTQVCNVNYVTCW